MSAIIFNVVVETVLRHWVSLVVEVEEGTYGWGMEVICRATFFYVVKGLIDSTKPKWLQGAFNTLTGLLEKVGLWTNIGKTDRILFRLSRAIGTQLEEAYELWMTGSGLT